MHYGILPSFHFRIAKEQINKLAIELFYYLTLTSLGKEISNFCRMTFMRISSFAEKAGYQFSAERFGFIFWEKLDQYQLGLTLFKKLMLLIIKYLQYIDWYSSPIRYSHVLF